MSSAPPKPPRSAKVQALQETPHVRVQNAALRQQFETVLINQIEINGSKKAFNNIDAVAADLIKRINNIESSLRDVPSNSKLVVDLLSDSNDVMKSCVTFMISAGASNAKKIALKEQKERLSKIIEYLSASIERKEEPIFAAVEKLSTSASASDQQASSKASDLFVQFQTNTSTATCISRVEQLMLEAEDAKAKLAANKDDKSLAMEYVTKEKKAAVATASALPAFHAAVSNNPSYTHSTLDKMRAASAARKMKLDEVAAMSPAFRGDAEISKAVGEASAKAEEASKLEKFIQEWPPKGEDGRPLELTEGQRILKKGFEKVLAKLPHLRKVVGDGDAKLITDCMNILTDQGFTLLGGMEEKKKITRLMCGPLAECGIVSMRLKSWMFKKECEMIRLDYENLLPLKDIAIMKKHPYDHYSTHVEAVKKAHVVALVGFVERYFERLIKDEENKKKLVQDDLVDKEFLELFQKLDDDYKQNLSDASSYLEEILAEDGEVKESERFTKAMVFKIHDNDDD